jgi:hypothetical protein
MLPNANLVARARQALYSLKREYGGRIDLYKLLSSQTDVRTGEKVRLKEVYPIQRAVILPGKRTRQVDQSISQISANKSFVMGGTVDETARRFLIDRLDVPQLSQITSDDWIVFAGRKYQIEAVEAFEFDTGWIVDAKELCGEIPEQIFIARADNLLNLTSQAITS